ncbi:hypothetical protein F5884DRAFT_746208 [Xylogone sp. PMI_703]|nr:hypothetical protein F5884DRAFT_746208 [Xylogone sp. PMI_703]
MSFLKFKPPTLILDLVVDMASQTLPKNFNPDFAVHIQQFTPTYYYDVYSSIDTSNPALAQDKKVIAIFGATGGIGPPLEELKADLATKFPNTDVLIVTTDVSVKSDVQNVFKEVTLKFSTIDIMISNAGAQTQIVLVGESDSDK